MQLRFLGAAGTTTGSMHMLEFEGLQILLDCGLYQGRRKDFYERNTNFPFDPRSIHSVVLSHAHIDHSGNLPSLVKQGFGGTIFATTATQDLCGAMLRDSAYIQEKDVEFVNKRRAKKGEEPVEPLYTMADAEQSLYNFNGVYYHRSFHVLRHLLCSFYDAGHILGSAITVLDAMENGREQHRIVYTGDLGRYNLPILRDPEVPSNVNTLIIESTYGNRYHGDINGVEKELADTIRPILENGGRVIIPSFAVGRAQELIYCLYKLWKAKALPRVPIYVDSPLAVNVTEIFRQHQECFDQQARMAFLQEEDPFGFSQLEYVRSVERSMELNTLREPCIVISASGMCEAGRILHHLRNNIGNPRNMVLFIGFQAANTLGRRLVEGNSVVRIFGEEHSVRAQIREIDSFSAHADAEDLIDYIQVVFHQSPDLRNIFIVHGEAGASNALAQKIYGETGLNPVIPALGDSFDI